MIKIKFIFIFLACFAIVAKAQNEPSKEALRQTLVHIQKLTKDQQIELDAAKSINESLIKDTLSAKEEVRNVLHANLEGLQNSISLQTEINEVTAWGNRKSQEATYWHEKQQTALKKLWWWRFWGCFTFIVQGVLFIGWLLFKFTKWGAKTIGPIVTKVSSF